MKFLKSVADVSTIKIQSKNFKHTPHKVKIEKWPITYFCYTFILFLFFATKRVLILEQNAANTLTRLHQNRQKLLHIQPLIVKDVDHKTNEIQIALNQLLAEQYLECNTSQINSNCKRSICARNLSWYCLKKGLPLNVFKI